MDAAGLSRRQLRNYLEQLGLVAGGRNFEAYIEGHAEAVLDRHLDSQGLTDSLLAGMSWT